MEESENSFDEKELEENIEEEQTCNKDRIDLDDEDESNRTQELGDMSPDARKCSSRAKKMYIIQEEDEEGHSEPSLVKKLSLNQSKFRREETEERQEIER